MKILIIGLSKISKAFLKNYQNKQEIEIYSPNSSIEGFTCFNSFKNITSKYTHIFLGCKPQNIENVASVLPQNCYNNDTIFISVLAGTTTAKISKIFNIKKIFRIMPSIAFEFGQSFIAWYTTELNQEEIEEIKTHFGKNKLIQCKNEDDIDNFTAFYASGIGFVFEIMNSFFKENLTDYHSNEKREMIINLFENACNYMKNNKNLSFNEAVSKVASKGGTTEAGLQVLYDGEINKIAKNAIFNAIKKAKELGN
jgi:pyrroline-5-carboxylate reductase